MPKTTYQKNEVIKHFFRTGTATKPTGLWVGLLGADPTEAGTQTSEVSGGSYARVQRNPSDANWSAPSSGRTGNAAAVTFPAPTADWNGGEQITYVAIFDAATGGNMRYYEALANPKTVNNGDPAPTFPINQLGVTEA